MKFLCVPCDKPMQLEGKNADRGSIALTYGCPDCGYEFAMLTNPMETQVVGSLGVKIGADSAEGESKCPFTGMVQELDGAGAKKDGVTWTSGAEQRMSGVPDFVKPMVRSGIERFARDKGYPEIDETVLDEAAATSEVPSLIHNRLGEVRVEQGRKDEARVLFARAIEENEEFPMPYFNLAVLEEERGDVRSAAVHYERAIELAPKYHQAQFNLGRLVGKQGQLDRQQELWEASIESDPNFVQGYYYLAKLLMDTGHDLGRAEELVRLGIDKDPNHEEGPLGHYILADILNRTGRRSEAMAAAETGRRIQEEMK